MKSLKIIFTLITIILILQFCKKPPKCETPLNVNISSLNVTFKDKTTGKYLYDLVNPIYNKDSIKINEQGQTPLVLLFTQALIPNTSSLYWKVDFGSLYNSNYDETSFSTEKCKDFIIKYNYIQSDTVKVCFKSKKTECGSVFETLKVYYKGQEILNTTNETATEITILNTI